MNILYYSDMPHVPTGYGTQTRWLLPELQKLGYGLKGFAKAGLDCGISRAEDVVWFPVSGNVGGNNMMKAHFDYVSADLMFILNDAWVHDPNILAQMPTLMWFPVDHEPIPPQVLHALAGVRFPVAYSRFGQEQAKLHGITADYVPHMIPTDQFRPKDREAARREMGIPQDAFMVGIVAVNNGGLPSRKAWEHQLRALGAWHSHNPDAKLALYLHTERSTLYNGVNIELIADIHGLRGCTYYAPPYEYNNGVLGTEQMATLYSALDVLMNCSMGEGCGLPILEAQACGTPVIVTDFSAMPEHVYAGWRVPVKDHIWTFQNSYMALPDVEGIMQALDQAHEQRGSEALRFQARHDVVMNHAVETVMQNYWKPLLERVAAELQADKEKQKRKVSVITPWHNHTELIPSYEKAMQGAEVIVIDNGSDPEASEQIHAMVERLRGVYIRNESYPGFSAANNQGMNAASGDVLIFVNNDVVAEKNWFAQLRGSEDDKLYGVSSGLKQVDGIPIPYHEGWCIAGTRAMWDKLGKWDESFKGGYWEDNELCFRAQQKDIQLVKADLPIKHLGGVTSATNNGMEHLNENYERFAEIVRKAMMDRVAV